MVVDTSALVAILLAEPESASFSIALKRDPVRLISVASVFEAGMVLQRRFGRPHLIEIDEAIARFPMEVSPVTLEQLHWARYAFETYGRGRHAARLNFGDCFSYALAKTTGRPILFKGDDFSQTESRSGPVLSAFTTKRKPKSRRFLKHIPLQSTPKNPPRP